MAILFVGKCKLTVLFAMNECDLNPPLPHTQISERAIRFLEGLQTLNQSPGSASGRF